VLRIDAHHHLWDPVRIEYEWMSEARMDSIRRPFVPADLLPELEACGIDATVVVQSANASDDTELILEHATVTDWIAGVVAWVPMTEPDVAARELERLVDYDVVRGIRHLAHDEPDPDWLVQPSVVRSLELIAGAGLVYDIPAVYPLHLGHAARLAELVPDLRIMIDHLGKPPAPAGREDFDRWSELMADCAAHENIYAKVSGLGTTGNGTPRPFDETREAVERAVELFGVDRLLYGSDWPVATLNRDYRATFDTIEGMLDELSESEREAVFGGTAVSVYGLTSTLAQASSAAVPDAPDAPPALR
jgi:L-fuconolactonase